MALPPRPPPPPARPRPAEPLFLQRQTYRRRRLMDAARLLPLAGAALFALPLMWAGPGAGGGAGGGPQLGSAIDAGQGATAGTAAGGVYVFAVWLGLILASALMSRRLVQGDAPRDAGEGPPPGRG